MFYEMATGRRAFSGNTSAVVFDAILNRDPPSATSLNPQLPDGLAHSIAKALQKNRQERYQSAAEILGDLKLISTAGQAGSIAQGFSRRRPRLTGLAMILTTFALVGLLPYYIVRDRQSRAGRETASSSAGPGAESSRRSVAVLGFRNLSGNLTKHGYPRRSQKC